MGTALAVNGMYKLDFIPNHAAYSVKNENSQLLLHRRVGHIGVDNMKLLKGNKLVNDVNNEEKLMAKCEVCVLGKYARLPFRDSQSKNSDLLKLLHSDVCGPIEQSSFLSSKYFVTLIDDFSKKVVVYGIQYKSKVTGIQEHG